MRAGDLLARSRDPFLPPSLKGTLVMPFTGGSPDWGGLAVDGAKGRKYTSNSQLEPACTGSRSSRPPITPEAEEAFP